MSPEKPPKKSAPGPPPEVDEAQIVAWMDEALAEARLALAAGEVPVGCVIYDREGRAIARAHDGRQHGADPLAHAEWIAMRAAAAAGGDWRLDGATLVVTLEPCPMCAGAILMARVDRIIFGAASPKWGAAGSRADWLGSGCFPHRPEVRGGVMAEECGRILTEYFRGLRGKRKDEK